ncbi:MAG: CZB domain-containing protein [Kofleriaceae bacterium]|nr:CZB domain-containing protein [Kofleriaceae bacterium]
MPLDFDGAIVAHRRWVARVRTYLHAPDGSIDADWLVQDDRCELGHWLRGRSCDYLRGLSEFATLVETHATFHAEAAAVVRTAHAGGACDHGLLAGVGSPLDQASTAVVAALEAVRRQT